MNEQDAIWRQWYDEHGARLLLFARQLSRSHAAAEDVLQDAFVRVWRSEVWRTADSIAPLLFLAVRRAAVDEARRSDRRRRREQILAEREESPEPHIFLAREECRDRRDAVERALAMLPEEQRAVLALKIWGEQTFAQIARILEIPQNTAASRYRYALGALREILAGEMEE